MPIDEEIFGKDAASPYTDADIFKDAGPEKPKPTMGREAPGAKPLSYADMMKASTQNLVRGLVTGGPMGMVVSGATEGLKNLGAVTDRAAYNAGGAVTDALAPYVPPEVAGGAGYATNVATQTVPMVVGNMLGKAVQPAMQQGGRELMQSALKPTIADLRKGNAAKAIDTLLEEGINPTQGGLDKLRSQIAVLDDQVANTIANSSATVNKGDVGTRLLDAYNKFRMQVNPTSDVNAIKQAWLEFKNHPSLPTEDIPVQVAQAMKQATYRSLGDKPYGELAGASQEAQKALARGLKEEISAAVPEVAGLNKKEGELLNAAKIVERRVLMDSNKNPLGLGVLNPTMWPLWLWDRSPLAKSLTARMLYSGSQAAPMAGAGLGAYYGMQQGAAPGESPALASNPAMQGVLSGRWFPIQ